MTKEDIASNYDDLLTNVEECNQALGAVWSWLNKTVDTSDQVAVFSFFCNHGEKLAILNLVMNRLQQLQDEHRKLVERAYKES
ncbi:hypothetical protein JavanS175_0012 [Streptococcus satellite phage Javan175]|uniref:hypothetical protein n=1 Tax=Streptococcus entericus TaxID=155680 RepID=UPI00036A64CC|nr:hypothetical protein [Streptococcus entericus]QBX07753.1 hypothetical protein JavanS175_0012 [Streptococcus satellite phage Javan175]